MTRAMRAAEAEQFELAAAWAEAHPAPVEERVAELFDATGALLLYGDRPLTIAGEGAPQMAEFAVDEFAAACAMTSAAGRAFLGAAVECKHRLPKIWARVLVGEVPVWKARRVTERTHSLSLAGAAYVDTHLARVLHSCSFAQIQRAVEAAAAETDDQADELELDRLDGSAGLGVEVRFDQAHLNAGRVPVYGLLDYPDALAFESTLQAKAAELKESFPELPLGQRRALALGRLGGEDITKEVVVYAHYQAGPAEAGHGIVDVEQAGATTLEQLYDWCRLNATRVTLRPVLDLDTEITVPGYRPSAELREQVILTCPTCVFPGCTRRARGCDLDHITAYRADGTGGTTTSWNLAPLCRLHHRMKTHGHWSYRRQSRTRFEWTSPAGRVYDVDHTHTRRRTR